MCNKYNGWTNYETWNVKLWLDNDQDHYLRLEELGRQAKRDQMTQTYRTVTGILADYLKDWVESDFIPDLGASMASDLLGSAISSVNWYEIAENILEDMPEEDAEDSDEEDKEELESQ